MSSEEDHDGGIDPDRRSAVGDSSDFGSAGSETSSNDGDSSSDSSDATLNFDDLSDDPDATDVAARHVHRTYTEVGSYVSYEEATAALVAQNEFIYRYETRYETNRLYARVYVCHSHVSCQHRLKIISRMEGDDVSLYTLAETGIHGEQATGALKRGIHAVLRDEVDSLLRLGMGGQELKNVLEHRYQDNPTMAAIVPTARQLTNRKAYISRQAVGGWDLRDFATFNAWASARMCTTREVFEQVSSPTDAAMDALVILDTFVFDEVSTDTPTTFGVVVTSRRVFRNVVTSVRDQGRELVCSTDGTYKLHFGGWTVVDCGSVRVTWTRQKYTHQFIPWVYMFVRTESTAAYQRMFEAVRTCARAFFDIAVNVAFGTMDHSDAIASAFEMTWPRIRLLTCWPHLIRQARKKRSLLSDPELFDAVMKPHIQLLESARSHGQFLRMSFIITSAWIDSGERAYAEWFRSVYLTRRWERWHVSASGVAGVVASQQSIEAHHRVIKRTCAPHSRASTGGVMTGILPRILVSDGATLCPTTSGLFCSGPLPPEMLMKAKRLVDSSQNYRRVHQGRGRRKRLVAIIFNAKRHIVGVPGVSTNAIGAAVDVHRATRFVNSINGEIADGITPAELRFEVLSLHQVTVGRNTPRERFPLMPEWSIDSISQVRGFLKCTCKSHVRTGWLCSHVLASLSLLSLLNLSAALSEVPVRRTPGRPPARQGALTADDSHEGFFSVPRLSRLFLRQPGHPLKWRLVDEFEVVVDDSSAVSNFVGTIVAVGLEEGVFVWGARFEDGTVRRYQVDELAEAVHRAHSLGMTVVP